MSETSTNERFALVSGASRGLGAEMARQLLEDHEVVFLGCREPGASSEVRSLASDYPRRAHPLTLDVTDEASIEEAARIVGARTRHLHTVINAAGILHDGDVEPEKRLADVEPARLQRVFAVNAFGPVLVAKHFAPHLAHGKPAVLANISARVGSIADDRLGGWYAYRASKAAQNMFTRNLSIELGRRNRKLVVLALHPGTVDTDLSKPFQGNVKPEKLFSRERAARQLLAIMRSATPEQTGSFIAWDGQPIPW